MGVPLRRLRLAIESKVETRGTELLVGSIKTVNGFSLVYSFRLNLEHDFGHFGCLVTRARSLLHRQNVALQSEDCVSGSSEDCVSGSIHIQMC